VIFALNRQLKGGSVLTREPAERQGKPLFHLFVGGGEAKCARRLDEFIARNSVRKGAKVNDPFPLPKTKG